MWGQVRPREEIRNEKSFLTKRTGTKDMLYITGTSIIVVFVARVHDAKMKSYGKIYCGCVRVYNLTWIQT